MTRKNKLYKHHKSKSYFYIKDFSFAILGLVAIGTAITVPTYIASHKTEEISIKAESNNANENENSEAVEENNQEEELLHY